MNKFEMAEKKFGLLDNFPLGICVLQEDFIVLFWNSQLESWTGIPKGRIVGTNLAAHFPHLNEPKYVNRIRIVFEAGPPTIFSSLLHKHIIPSPLRDGQFRIQHTTVISVPAFDGEEFYALFAIQDVTDLTLRIQDYRAMRDQAMEEIKKRKWAEEQLRNHSLNLEKMVEERTSELKKALNNLQKTQSQLVQSEKMASIGQLAAGIAHEINNPTGYVSSNLNSLAEYVEDARSLIAKYRALISELKQDVITEEVQASISEKLDSIAELEGEIDIDFLLDDSENLIKESQEGSERIKKIVIDLKDFAHPGDQELKYADLNHNLESTLNIVWNELKYKATVTKDYGDLPEVQCYPQQINQVFMNLLLNAAQSIEKHGEIRIVTRAVDGYVEIKISDTGPGIPKEDLSKIFDPFFTTKGVGKGTGLGLNIAYNIIKKHKGTIDVESTVGKGTTFTIRIPVG